MSTTAVTPIPIPALAPDDRPLEDVDFSTPESFGDDVPLLFGAVFVVESVGAVDEVVVVARLLSGELAVGVLDVVAVPEWVETTAPKPFRTIPRLSAQHAGSLSQQKLPSEHSTARGRKPVPGSVC